MSEEIKPTASIRFASMASHKAPIFKEEKIGNIIKYGEDLQYPYPDYLIRLYQSSPKHSSIINAKNRYTIGGGWSINYSDLNKIQQAKAQNILNNANPNETLNEVTFKADLDWNIFGGFAVECIWDKGGSNVVEQYHIDFAKVRIFNVGDDKKPVYKYAYLNDWRGVMDISRAKQKPEYREWDYFGTKKTGAELLYYKNHKPVKSGELDVYPLPEYVSACGYIEADLEIENYHINNIKNQFWGGQVVTMTNIFTTEENQKKFVRDFKAKKTGTDNAGDVTFVFANSLDQKVETTPLTPSDLDKQFEILNKAIRDEIFTVHNVTTPLLFGIRTDSGFGGNKDEMLQGYELFYTSYIQPKQQQWAEIQNFIYAENGIGGLLTLKKLSLIQTEGNSEIQKMLESINSLNPLVANKVLESLSVTEIRSLVGLKTVLSELATPIANSLFAEQERIESYFATVGEIISDDDIVFKVGVELENGSPIHTDYQFKNLYFKDVIGIDLDEDTVDVLSVIKSNKKIGVEGLSDALGLTKTEVQNIIDKLFESGLLKGNIGDNIAITKSGGEILNDEDIVLDIEVKYRYSEIHGIPKAVSGSRPYCEKRMAESNSGKVYSRAEIDALSSSPDAEGGAWLFRGGFYTNPKTDETTPYCRHFWESVIIKKRRK
jgi:hypothetical protein